MLGQKLSIIFKFLNQVTDFAGFDFNYKWLRSLQMLGGDQQVTKKLIWTNLLFNCRNDFNRIGSIGP
jgi:hypothetical protein